LFRFVGGVIEQQYDDTDQSEGKAETGRNEKQADRADRNGAQGEREREWQLRKLRHINLELYHQIGDFLRIKLQVLDAIERIEMAQLERLEKNRLRASLKLAKGKLLPTSGIGILQVRKRAARMGRNPAPGRAG